MKGIDVSDNQGLIDWAKAKADGVEFAILRTTRRSKKPDHYLPTNIKACHELNIPIGFYKYSYALTVEDAMEEAKLVVNTLLEYGIEPSRKTMIWMDVEDKTQIALSTDKLTEIVQAFKYVVTYCGFGFGLYMGKYAYESNELSVEKFNDDIWLARYYNGYKEMRISDNPNKDYIPRVKAGKLWGWQYTSSGMVDGINGRVDLNESYYDINVPTVNKEYYGKPEFTLIESLNKIGVDSSFQNRKIIASKNGIAGYEGTYEQNLKMLNLLNKGELVKNV